MITTTIKILSCILHDPLFLQKYIPLPSYEVPVSHADISLSQQVLGYQPKTSVEEGTITSTCISTFDSVLNSKEIHIHVMIISLYSIIEIHCNQIIIEHYWTLFQVSVLVISERCNSYCNKCTSDYYNTKVRSR